ncbi:MAG: hypothetical protein ACM3JI_01160, partial [Anaerolineae bacterium]
LPIKNNDNSLALASSSASAIEKAERKEEETSSNQSSGSNRESFKKYAQIYGNKFLGELSVELLMHHQIAYGCEVVSAEGDHHLKKEFYLSLYESAKEGNYKKVCEFIPQLLEKFGFSPPLQTTKQEASKEMLVLAPTKQEINSVKMTHLDQYKSILYQSHGMTLSLLDQILKTNQTELLHRSVNSFCETEFLKDSVVSKRAAVKSYQYLAKSTFWYLQITSFSMAENSLLLRNDRSSVSKQGSSWDKEFSQECLSKEIEQIKVLEGLTPECKTDLILFFQDLAGNFYKELIEFHQIHLDCLEGELQDRITLFLSKRAERIGDLSQATCDDFSFIKENLDVYLDFPSRLADIQHWRIDMARSLESKALILQDFFWMIRCGDLTPLKELPPGYVSRRIFLKAVDLTMKTFKQQRNSKQLFPKIMKGFKEHPTALKYSKFFQKWQLFFEEQHELLQACLAIPLKDCLRLDLEALFASKPRLSSHSKKVAAQTQFVEELRDIEAKKEVEEAKKEDAKPLSLIERLKDFQETLLGSLQKSYNPDVKSAPFGFNEALKNSEDHLQDLFVLIARFLRLSKKTMDKDLVFNYVRSLVSHGTLLEEQLLAATLRKTKMIKTLEELKPTITHNLELIVNGCHFGSRPLKAKERQLIRSTNFGEVSVRNIGKEVDEVEFKEKEISSVDDLLKAVYLWNLDLKSSDPKPILKAAIKYFCGVLKVCKELGDRLSDTKKTTQELELEKKDFEKQLAQFRIELFKVQDDLKMSEDEEKKLSGTLKQDLTSIETFVLTLLERPLPAHSYPALRNVLNNLLKDLKAELSLHKNLPIKELRVHLSEILLVNQCIAEELLYVVSHLRRIAVDKKAINHDLVELIKKLGIEPTTLPKNVQDFLHRGRETRGLARYRASFHVNDKEKPIQRALRSVIDEASKLAHQTLLLDEFVEEEEGFESVWQKEIDAIKANISEDVTALKDLLSIF